MALYTKFVSFTFNWKVKWSEYDKISNVENYCPHKNFVIAYNNAVFHWKAQLEKPVDAEYSKTITFGIHYVDGPLEMIRRMTYYVGIVKTDGSVQTIDTSYDYNAIRGNVFYILEFDDKDSAVIRTKYGLQEAKSLVYQITMRIPMEDTFGDGNVFLGPFSFSNPIVARLADWFKSIQNSDSSKFSDAVLISRDGVEFYCHKIIIAQTEPLETMVSDPLASLERPRSGRRRGTKRKHSSTIDDPPTSGKNKRVYPFKKMSTPSLKAMIEYLYTGESTLNDLTVSEAIQVADAAEQYLLKPLKRLCAVHLWECVVDKPKAAFKIARFADLHDDCKYLKDRALDVIVENYQKLKINPKLLPKRFGGTRGEELKDELMNYMALRLRPYID